MSTFVREEEIIERMRHAALIRKGDTLHVYFTRMRDKPERIFLSYINLDDNGETGDLLKQLKCCGRKEIMKV